MFQADLLKGQHILITGGGTGLGRSMALRFAGLGARVFLAGRREEPLRETAEEINKGGAAPHPNALGQGSEGEASPGRWGAGQAAWATGDVRDFAAVEKIVEAAWRVAPLTALVNNAAGNFISPTERLSPNAFASVVGIVLNGSFHCTLACGRRWIEAKQPASVLNILATYVWTGSGYVVPSACAKAGVLALTRSLAVEWARHRIRLNAIAPGPFPTEGAWSRIIPSKEYEEAHRRRHPMGRFGRHDELTNLAAFLLAPQTEYINGDCVTIDGAEWLRHGGEFSYLEEVPASVWDQLEQARKSKK